MSANKDPFTNLIANLSTILVVLSIIFLFFNWKIGLAGIIISFLIPILSALFNPSLSAPESDFEVSLQKINRNQLDTLAENEELRVFHAENLRNIIFYRKGDFEGGLGRVDGLEYLKIKKLIESETNFRAIAKGEKVLIELLSKEYLKNKKKMESKQKSIELSNILNKPYRPKNKGFEIRVQHNLNKKIATDLPVEVICHDPEYYIQNPDDLHVIFKIGDNEIKMVNYEDYLIRIIRAKNSGFSVGAQILDSHEISVDLYITLEK